MPHANLRGMTSFIKNLFFAAMVCISFLPFTSTYAALTSTYDVPFYDTDAGSTRYFFRENDSIYTMPCPAGKVIHQASECDASAKRQIFKASEGADFFFSHLKDVIKPANDIAPFNAAELTTLLSSTSQNSQDLLNQKNTLLTQKKDAEEFLQTFGNDSATQKKLNQVLGAIKAIDAQVQANQSYDALRNEFNALANSFISIISDNTKLTSLLASKSIGTFPYYFAKMMTKLRIPRDGSSDCGDLHVGSKIIVGGGSNYSKPFKDLYGKIGTITSLNCPIARIDLLADGTWDIMYFESAE